ncbi:MAG TPA: family 10 glycosylhydrolase [Bacteroidales bacterium]|nr:family 10 glycosylhydrolase [Bacteroidales bacterium]
MKIFLLFVFLFPFSFFSIATQPARELRGTWFTTAWRIDWPPVGSVQTQKNSLIQMFDRLEAANVNVVFFQVRPFADAFYHSAHEPWSHLLGTSSASRGQYPGYDPLQFAIEQAHQRGMELHAWLNPYRFESVTGSFAGLPGDYARTHPHLVINFNNSTILDPGHPETTQIIKNIVADIVHNYDVDGIIFDDYFYPVNMPLNLDQHTFDAFGNEAFIRRYYHGPLFTTLTRGDFRRASVNNMIREVNDTIKSINPSLLFGVSPAGIYTTNHLVAQFYGTTLPPGITGANNWSTINADPLAWLKHGYIDYLSPQLYWPIGGGQDFIALDAWWGEQARRFGRHHYPSLGSYRLYDALNWPVTEIGNQIIAHRNNPANNAPGYIFFHTSGLLNLSKNLAGHLRSDLFSQKTILPVASWLPAPTLRKPRIIDVGSIADDNELVVLNMDSNADRFLLFGSNEPPDAMNNLVNPQFLQVAFGNRFSLNMQRNFRYLAVAEYARNKTIGENSGFIEFIHINPPTFSLHNGATLCEGNQIIWNEIPGISRYSLMVFDGPSASSLLKFETDTIDQRFFNINSQWFEGQKTYFYRVKAINNRTVSYSLIDRFNTGFPSTPAINNPLSGQQNVNFTSVAQWQHLPEATNFHLQVSQDPLFGQGSLIIDRPNLTQNMSNITLQAPNTTHYLRVAGINACGRGQWSPVVQFTTTAALSVEDIDPISLRVYPNPATTRFFLTYPQNLGRRTISLFNTSGQKMWQVERGEDTRLDELSLEGLPVGFYIGTVITQSGKVMTFKVMKVN